jgi:hypothetical protein
MYIYDQFIHTGRAPAASAAARAFGFTLEEARSTYRELEAAHVIALQESGEILRAAPFWATPTAFTVEAGGQSWWGSCIWDALGIPAMLQSDARILTSCGCCAASMTLEVQISALLPAEGVIHFAVPAAHWYEDLVFT